MSKILIIRFSAFGDVAMTLPVIFSLAKRYPQQEFIFLTHPFFQDLQPYFPSNVRLLTVDVKKKYRGFWGLYRLHHQLRKEDITAVADLHDVLRTKILRLFFFIQGLNVKIIDKGRKDKAILTRKIGKHLWPLKSQFARYQKVFSDLNLPFKMDFQSILPIQNQQEKQEKILGIAPFSKHLGKTYPLEKIEKIIHFFDQKKTKIVIFAAHTEVEKLKFIQEKYPNLEFFIGEKIVKILKKMQKISVLLSMDSANQHFASLVQTPVISIWGATHPYLGFSGWQQKPEHQIVAKIYCSPCSTFGQKPCFRKDYACMTTLESEQVIKKLEQFLL